jgi:hypothetical protein
MKNPIVKFLVMVGLCMSGAFLIAYFTPTEPKEKPGRLVVGVPGVRKIFNCSSPVITQVTSVNKLDLGTPVAGGSPVVIGFTLANGREDFVVYSESDLQPGDPIQVFYYRSSGDLHTSSFSAVVRKIIPQ